MSGLLIASPCSIPGKSRSALTPPRCLFQADEVPAQTEET